MYESITQITTLDVAITSVCNAHCMDCARWWVDEQGELYDNPLDTHRNQHWPWRRLADHTDVLSNIQRVLITGNAGDPLSHPHIADLVHHWRTQWPHSHIEIDTNGSLGTPETWQRLRDCAVSVRFAVDGLEHTNHIYRKSVPWHRVVHNIRQWHSLGGDGTLKTIDFPWNAQDRDQIKAWSQQLGFEWLLDHRWQPDLDDRIQLWSRNPNKPQQWSSDHNDDEAWQHESEQIIHAWTQQGQPMRPECKDRGDWLYINHDHRVWPCCYWATSGYMQWHTHKRQLEHLQRQADADWNSLDHHSLQEIISHPLLTNLESLWQGTDSNTACLSCVHNCGKVNNS